MWLVIVGLVLLTEKPATMLAQYFLHGVTNFRATMLISTLCNVLLMSLVMTILGAWIGTFQISFDAVRHFPTAWPRNFTLALIVEAGIA